MKTWKTTTRELAEKIIGVNNGVPPVIKKMINKIKHIHKWNDIGDGFSKCRCGTVVKSSTVVSPPTRDKTCPLCFGSKDQAKYFIGEICPSCGLSTTGTDTKYYYEADWNGE